MKTNHIKFKKGAASFYIVAISTLILTVVSASFAIVVLSEVTRTSNDDLSQSAYDSALAGVEDAKLAYSNYQRCIAAGYTGTYSSSVVTQDGTVSCQEIVYWMQNPDCDMVGHILGRIKETESGEVAINDTLSTSSGSETSEMNQAYTCVTISTGLDDYRSTLSTTNSSKIIKVSFSDSNVANSVKAVRVSWYSNREDVSYAYTNFATYNGSNRVAFQTMTNLRTSTPPTLELKLVQTAGSSFTLSSFDLAVNNTTNRATVYLVPNNDKNVVASSVNTNYYIGTYNGSINSLSAAQVAKSNDRTIKNKPYGVYCNNTDDEFACSAVINLPNPVDTGSGSYRNNDTFMLALSLPYKTPDTDFSLEFCTTTDCSGGSASIVGIENSQVVIDSTGRANDLYRRVEARLESTDNSFAYPEYAIELLGSDNNTLEKWMTVTSEYNFYF